MTGVAPVQAAARSPLKILLIAYDFPPIPSPQSLRWAYLCRGLARLGHEVHVLAPRTAGYGAGGLPALPSGVVVHRAFPGLAQGLVEWRSRRRRPGSNPFGDRPAAEPATETVLNWKGQIRNAGLNWKGRLHHRLKRVLGYVQFPDERGAWEPWARRKLFRLLEELRPDVVVSSHEPATTLRIGAAARELGYPWVADLGDPVLAPYTARRWKAVAMRLERHVCAHADQLIVTTEAARTLMVDRHDMPESRITVVTQGYDDDAYGAGEVLRPDAPQGSLDLLYTGSFYDFRRADALVQAVLATDGVTLSIASANTPRYLRDIARTRPDRIRLLGFLPHAEVIRRQRAATMLVDIGNESQSQIPGKFYEYLGAGRPILQVGGGTAAADTLRRLRRGVACGNDTGDIQAALAALAAAAGDRELDAMFDLTRSTAEYGWSSLAVRVEGVLYRAAEGRHDDRAVAKA